MLWLGLWGCSDASVARVATFNIESFPRSERQIAGAMQAIRRAGAPVVGVQEITRPDVFQQAASERLGPSWTLVTHVAAGASHRVGLLYDAEVFTMDYARAHDAVRVVQGGRPALEVRLVPRRGRPLRVFVVHLKAGGSEHVVTRRLQLSRLATAVGGGVSSDVRVVLGDFNATTLEDRSELARFSRTVRLDWASVHLGCTAFREVLGRCEGTALDHVFVDGEATVRADAPCSEIGCWSPDRCPSVVREVSDHCPVTARLVP